jgi:hypothetical protein
MGMTEDDLEWIPGHAYTLPTGWGQTHWTSTLRMQHDDGELPGPGQQRGANAAMTANENLAPGGTVCMLSCRRRPVDARPATVSGRAQRFPNS